MNREMQGFGVPCVFHSQEIITNFCKSEHCLLPLCPKCIKTHVDEHRATGTFADVESIDQSLRQVSSNLEGLSRLVKKSGEELIDIQTEKRKIRETVRVRLQQAKIRMLKEVERSMDKIEKNVLKQITDFEESVFIELEEVDDRLRTLLSKIIRCQDELNSDRCLKTLILFHSSDMQPEIAEEAGALERRAGQIRELKFDLVTDEEQVFLMKKCIKDFVRAATNDPNLKDITYMYNIDRTSVRQASRYLDRKLEDLN